MRKLLLLVVAALAFGQAQARPLTADEKLSDLHQMVSRLKSGYGPLQYKKKIGIDIDVVAQKYANKVTATKSNGEFYYEMIKFIAEFKDGHFSANLPTTYQAALPFSVDLVQGKVLIDEVNRQLLPANKFPYQRGDEIVEFGGQPVMDAVKELEPYVPNGYELSVVRLAAMSLTTRTGKRFPVPADKNVTMKIRRGTSAIVDPVKMEWIYSGEQLDENDMTAPVLTHGFAGSSRRDYADLSIFTELETYNNPLVEKNFRCSGATRIQIPADAKVIMMTPFVAYYHPTAKGNVGYLRIPHYSPTMEDQAADATELRLRKYEYAVSVLEANTVGLVIDQQHNCGGSVSYLHDVASLLMTKPFAPIQFELLANKEEYLGFRQWVTDRYKDTIEYFELQKTIALVKEAWEKGLGMTPKTALAASPVIQPNFIHYTKPIVMLIDELSGSGGDAFPALLQGNGRAILIGERTMGLGGHVEEQVPLFYSQIQPRITKSLFYHPNGTPIENNGASPDVPYQPSRDDFMYGYRDFQNFYVAELLKHVP